MNDLRRVCSGSFPFRKTALVTILGILLAASPAQSQSPSESPKDPSTSQNVKANEAAAKDPAEETEPAVGLEFLKPYPKLHRLSLEMSEKQFGEILEENDVPSRKSTDGGKSRYTIPLGDGHSLLVSFNDAGKCGGIQRVRGEDRDSIQVELKLERTEFLLGESIAVEYQMTNQGNAAAPYEKGAVYPDLRINDGFTMSAIRVDDKGKPLAKPATTWPMPEYTGGPVGNFQLKPRQSWSATLFVTRYIRFDEPGRYRLRIENVDRHNRGVANVYSSGVVYVTLKQPTAEQARKVFEQMKKAPREAYHDNSMQFLSDAADFQAIHQPFYLPVLKEFASKGDLDALQSLEQMGRMESNEIIVAAMSSALDQDDWESARICFDHLKNCLPFPNWYNEPLSDYDKEKRDRVTRTWKAEFVPVLIRFARRLNAEVAVMMKERERQPRNADARDPEFMAAFRRGTFPDDHPQSLLRDLDYVYRCVGRPEDFADCLQAFAHSIELTRTLPLETQQYFRPRGSASGFSHTVGLIMKRGAKPPVKPTHPGEAAAFAMAIRFQPDFRPDGWQSELLKWLKGDSPYLSELILQWYPEPVPDAVLDYLPEALDDDYVDLQIAACHVAGKNPRPAYQVHLKKILDTAKDPYLRKYAVDAARANGIKAKYDPDAPFVDQDKENQ